MEDIISTLILGRIIERVSIIVVACISIILGWKLFSLPLENAGEADIQHGGFRLILKRIAPGVFFAAFGSTILVMSLTNSPTLEITENPAIAKIFKSLSSSQENANKVSSSPSAVNMVSNYVKYSGAASIVSEEEGLLEVIMSLNTVISATTKIQQEDARLQAAILSDLSHAGLKLQKFRDDLLVEILGSSDIAFWKQNAEIFKENPKNFSEKERNKLDRIGKWFNEGEALSFELSN